MQIKGLVPDLQVLRRLLWQRLCEAETHKHCGIPQGCLMHTVKDAASSTLCVDAGGRGSAQVQVEHPLYFQINCPDSTHLC